MEGILNRIKEIRTAKKISQDQISKHLGITQAAYAKVESSKSITVDRLYKVAEILNVSVGDLLRIELTENKGQEAELKSEILRLNDIINGQKKLITILEEQNEILKPFRSAFIQERTISELMVSATVERMKELAQKGEKIEITSFDVRQAAIAIYQKEYPDIEINPYLFIPPGNSGKN